MHGDAGCRGSCKVDVGCGYGVGRDGIGSCCSNGVDYNGYKDGVGRAGKVGNGDGPCCSNAAGRAGKVGSGDGPCCSNAGGRAGKVGSGDGPACRSNAAGRAGMSGDGPCCSNAAGKVGSGDGPCCSECFG